MFAHLEDPPVVCLEEASVEALLSAQASTAEWLTGMGVPSDVMTDEEAQAARTTFQTLTTSTDPNASRSAIIALRTPPAVRHLAGMLSQYDWDFVEQAKELRGYVVAKLLEETQHHEARVRLRALEMVGKLTEVGSFTERIEITKKDEGTEALTLRLKEKLESLRAAHPRETEAVLAVVDAATPLAPLDTNQ